MRKKVTIAQVAKIAGVSTTTVSRVMSNTGRISQSTRERVFSVIERLEYQPSAIAKGLIESKTYNLGIILSINNDDYNYYENNFLQLFLQGINSFIKKYNYDIVITSGNENDDKFIENFIKKQKADGIIILKSLLNSQHILKLKKMSFPFVVVGKPNIENVSYVDSNDFETMYRISKKFIELCGNQIAYISYDKNLYSNQNKILGLEKSLTENDLYLDESLIYLGKNILERELFLQKLLSSKKTNKALITGDNISLLYALDYFKKNKINIPNDIQLISFSDNDFYKIISPTISAISCSAFEIGEKAGILIYNLLNNSDIKSFTVENQINLRESTLITSI